MKVYVIFDETTIEDGYDIQISHVIRGIATTIDKANEYIEHFDAKDIWGNLGVEDLSKEWRTESGMQKLVYKYVVSNGHGDNMYHHVYWDRFETID